MPVHGAIWREARDEVFVFKCIGFIPFLCRLLASASQLTKSIIYILPAAMDPRHQFPISIAHTETRLNRKFVIQHTEQRLSLVVL